MYHQLFFRHKRPHCTDAPYNLTQHNSTPSVMFSLVPFPPFITIRNTAFRFLNAASQTSLNTHLWWYFSKKNKIKKIRSVIRKCLNSKKYLWCFEYVPKVPPISFLAIMFPKGVNLRHTLVLSCILLNSCHGMKL